MNENRLTIIGEDGLYKINYHFLSSSNIKSSQGLIDYIAYLENARDAENEDLKIKIETLESKIRMKELGI